MVKNFDGKGVIYVRTPIIERFHLIPLLSVLVLFFLFSVIIMAENTMPDPAPKQITQYLERKGYDMSDVYFEIIRARAGYLPDIYRSSEAILYENRETELWEVRCMAINTKVYYIIRPFYGESP